MLNWRTDCDYLAVGSYHLDILFCDSHIRSLLCVGKNSICYFFFYLTWPSGSIIYLVVENKYFSKLDLWLIYIWSTKDIVLKATQVMQLLELEFGGKAQDLAILIKTLGDSYAHGIGSTVVKSHCPLVRVLSSYEQVPGTNLFQNSKGPSIWPLLPSTWINEMSLKF